VKARRSLVTITATADTIAMAQVLLLDDDDNRVDALAAPLTPRPDA
jgi:hypothetical protein